MIMKKKDQQKIIDESNEAWKKLAEWWDNDIGDGDPYHRLLVFPQMIELTDCKLGQKLLDIACGNGTLSRRFNAQGADVVAVDLSDIFIQQAIEKSESSIDFSVMDVTSRDDLSKLTKHKFDKIVCSMALHDLPTIQPLMEFLPKLLSEEGSFIFSIPHPCFNMGDVKLDFFSDTPHLSRSRYIRPQHIKMKSKPNQPIDQHCFHRSITEIFKNFFSIGMVVNGFVEPALCDVSENLDNVELDWKLLPEISPVMICRCIFDSS